MAYPEGLEPPTPWSVAKRATVATNRRAMTYNPLKIPLQRTLQ